MSRFGNTEIIGDPTVATAVADGPHRAHQDGDTMVFEQTPVSEDPSFEFVRPQGRVVISGFGFGRKLTVRVNPSLPLNASVQAGNLRIELGSPRSGERGYSTRTLRCDSAHQSVQKSSRHDVPQLR